MPGAFYERQDRIAFIVVSNPPANAISQVVRPDCLQQSAANSRRGIVLVGERRAFTTAEAKRFPVINDTFRGDVRKADLDAARRSGDSETIYLNGYGPSAWRGGPMFYADTLGLNRVLTRAREFNRHFGDRRKPVPLLEKLVVEGRHFADRKNHKTSSRI